MKISKLFMGIECNAAAADGSALRGLLSGSVLEDVLGASASEASWLQVACAHGDAIRSATQREAARRGCRTVVVSELLLRQSLTVLARIGLR